MRTSFRVLAASAVGSALTSSTPAKARLTTNIVGGLGNQLFLVANLLATSRRTGIPAYLEAAPLSGSSGPPRPTYWDSLFCDLETYGVQMCRPGQVLPLLPIVMVPEMRPVQKVRLDAQQSSVFNMIGFFQSHIFFDDYPLITSAIPPALWGAAREHLSRYNDGGSCHTVALHVRRGDYTQFADIFVQLDVVEYYDAAVQQLLGGFLLQPPSPHRQPQAPSTHLLIFCEEERYGHSVVGYFRAKYKHAVMVSLVCAAAEANREPAKTAASPPPAPMMPRDVLELLMMAQCNDVVMANSTFSWWGAYLNRVALRRVIAPSKWFVKDPYPASNHLYCPGWVLI